MDRTHNCCGLVGLLLLLLLLRDATLKHPKANVFLMEIDQYFKSMEKYEEERIQKKALAALPLQLLQERAQQRMRSLQKQVKSGNIDDVNVSIQEMLLLELLAWFKDNFEWVDNPDCDHCGNATKFSHMSDDPKLLAHANRVEMHRCEYCSKLTPFYRYTNLDILLVTREGRCGEWASAFTLFCRALKWDTRYVFDKTDHVWTEVYSVAQKRWLHCDPCENVCDNPLIYESGWGKKLSYVIAFSCEEIQDVTWRYTSDHKKVLENRNLCSELDLVQTMMRLRDNKQKNMSQVRRNYLNRRLVNELVELMIETKPNDSEKQGRVSGSLTWRIQRGEAGENNAVNHIWSPTDEELTLGTMTVRYSPTLNQYERLNVGKSSELLKNWEKGVYKSNGLFRKEERDWKTVYLCRQEGISEGEIEWRFETKKTNKVIDKVNLVFNRSVFENGQIKVQLSGDNCSICLPSEVAELSTSDLSGSTALTLRATLSGGKGDCAWQHAQLFRQSTGVTDVYPFHVHITFKNI